MNLMVNTSARLRAKLPCHSPTRSEGLRDQSGAALIIVLAFIVMLLVLLLAFFSRATLQEQISKSSSSFTVADVFAEGATESIIGDLRQEIVAGSVVSNIVTAGSSGSITNTLYYPITNTTFEPVVSGFVTNGDVLNLVKISSSSNFAPIGVQLYTNNISTNQVFNRATADSTTNTSLNGRYISPARWNQPLFITLSTNGTSTLDTTPSSDFTPPSWILVARDGSNPGTNTGSNSFNTNMVWSPTNTTTVVGRYAYAIYNEGGVMDANVAGYPTNANGTPTGMTASNTAYSSAEAFATLSELGMTSNQISALVGWRNFASAPVSSGSYPTYTFTSATNYAQMAWGNTNGFMRVATNVAPDGITSDRMFSSRQQLISFMEGADPANVRTGMAVMQYLSTHTRDLNQPSYAPATNRPTVLNTNLGGNSAFTNGSSSANTIAQDSLINPSFLSIRVTNSFTRSDGSTAVVGQPLVTKRFALNRIAWLTYKGPSANLSQTDPEYLALLSNGITAAFLQQGTAANIKNYFGLEWNSSGYWTYNVHNGSGSGSGAITTLPAIAAERNGAHDPDFFEMLKASIAVGSLGKSAVNSSTAVQAKIPTNGTYIYTPSGYLQSQVPANFRYPIDSSVDYHIIQIGANIINQFHADSFPRRILFNDGSNRGSVEFDGVADLPYLTYIYNGVLRQNSSNAVIVQVPVVWNVYDPNGARPSSNNSSLAPTQFRAAIDDNDPLTLAANPSTPNDLPYYVNSSGILSNSAVFAAPSNVITGDKIVFSSGIGNSNAFREPTWLLRAKSGAGSTGINLARTAGNITCIDSNILNGPTVFGSAGAPNNVYVDPAGSSYAPFVLGGVQQTFKYNNSNTVTSTIAYIGPANYTNENRVYFTYRLQYTTNNGSTWITYDTKYGRISSGYFPFNTLTNGVYTACIGRWADFYQPWTWGAAIDPRSARFGLFSGGCGSAYSDQEFNDAPSVDCQYAIYATWIDPTNGISLPLRPDQCAGHYVADIDVNDPYLRTNGVYYQPSYLSSNVPMTDIPYPRPSAGWSQILTGMEPVIGTNQQAVPGFALGMYAQNNVSVLTTLARFLPEPNDYQTGVSSYYADADGVVRRASYAYMGSGTLPNNETCSATNPVGQPEAACMNNPPFVIPSNVTNPYTPGHYSSLAISTNQIVPWNLTPNPSGLTQSQSRPLFLHRPFRSVAELGYVFRDLPWKNIDFFTPESGDTALLDTFCINDTSDPNNLVAGRLDLNTRKTNVISAIIMGAYIDDPKVTNTTIGTISRTLSTNIAIAFNHYTATNASSGVTNNGPLMNLAQLVGRYVSNSTIASVTNGLSGTNYKDGKSSYVGFSGIFATNGYNSANAADLTTAYYQALSTNSQYLMSMINIQRFHEAPIRALSAAGQERVWNLMIDVIAQTGRYPVSASKLQNFVVEGEQRYWVHLSIDRLTGQVIDKQIEVVK